MALLACTAVAVLGLYVAVGYAAGLAVDEIDRSFQRRYEADAFGYYSKYADGMPLANQVVLEQIKCLDNDETNYVVIGSSTTQEGVLEQQLQAHLPADVHYVKCAAPGMGINELIMMVDLLEQYGNVKLDKQDVVKIDIGVGFFKNRTRAESILAQTLEAGGVYRVDADNHVSSGLGCAALYMPLLKTQSLISETKVLLKDESITVKPYDPSLYKRYQSLWVRCLHDFDLSAGEQQRFLDALERLSKYTNVVVESMYAGSWLRETPQGQSYQTWVDESLKPWLAARGMKLIDNATALPDAQYVEQSHLNYAGRVAYTQLEQQVIADTLQVVG